MQKGIFEGAEAKIKRLLEHEKTLLEARAIVQSDLEIIDKALAEIKQKKTKLELTP